MTKTTWCGTLAALSLLAAAPSAGAQEVSLVERGWQSVAVSTNGDLGVGFWARVGDRTDLGVTTVLSYNKADVEDEVEANAWMVAVEPAVRMYWSRVGPVQPYTHVGVFAAYARTTASAADVSEELVAKQTQFGGSFGVGAEWFPTQRLSLGGHVGVQGGVQNVSDEFGAEEEETDGFFLSTFNSGVTLRLFL